MDNESQKHADALVTRFILRKFREDTQRAEKSHAIYSWQRVTEAASHLARCDSAQVAEEERSNGVYGCDTGCEYARLEAVIACDHGFRDDFEYGEFGDLGDLLAEVMKEEREKSAGQPNIGAA